MGSALVWDFHTRCLHQKSHSLAVLARSISDTSPTRAKIPYARPAHEVISMEMTLQSFSEFLPLLSTIFPSCKITLIFNIYFVIFWELLK